MFRMCMTPPYNHTLGFTVRKRSLSLTNEMKSVSLPHPFGLAGGHGASFAVSEGFPRYLSQERTALRANVIDLEAIGNVLQLLGNLGGLLRPQIDTDRRSADRDE